MSSPQDQERLRRLRDRQLLSRDPQKKQQQMHGRIARKQRQSVESFSLGRMWSEIPHIWKGAFYGLTIGVLAVVVVPLVWISPWALPCSAAAALMLMILGLLIGRAQDTRDSLRDLVR
jgi:VIT1/CCC1 family predicted Fe2+/Mn2+ transporter